MVGKLKIQKLRGWSDSPNDWLYRISFLSQHLKMAIYTSIS